jgi:type II secretory pathway pseudopilin PulG
LAILGVIATFTIPKILQAQQDGRDKAIAKEAAQMVSSALEMHRLSGNLNDATSMSDLTPYMNFVRLDTSLTIDSYQGAGNISCSGAPDRCLLLHNGATLLYDKDDTFCTDKDGILYFYVDPDGKETVSGGTTTGKSVMFFVYKDGRVRTFTSIVWPSEAGANGGPECDFHFNPTAGTDPPWFSWD